MITQSSQKPIPLTVHPPCTAQESPEQPQGFRRLGAIAQKMINGLAPDSRLTLQQIGDRLGNVIWRVSDPEIGPMAHLESQEEVRIWIENRFYARSHQYQDAAMDFHLHQSRLLR